MTWIKVRIKAPYVCGRTGAALHKTDPGHRFNAAQLRWPNRVEYRVKTQCKAPSIINDAVLALSADDRTPRGRKYYESLKPLQLCKRCFPERQ